MCEQYPPAMMLELLVYCYITGTFSSRRIQQATYTDVAVRYICGGKAHPEFSVICAFRREIEARYEEVREGEQAAKEQQTGKKPGGKPPSPPKAEPPGNSQYNFTDPESRIMKAGNGQHFEQAYNAQAAVDVGSMLIAGEYVTNHGNDKKELEPIVTSVDGETYTVERVCADSGFYSEEAVKAAERRGIVVLQGMDFMRV